MKQKLHALFHCQKSIPWQNFNKIKLFILFFSITSSFAFMANAQGTAVIRTVGTTSFCRTGAPINATIRVDITGGTGPYTVVYRAAVGGSMTDFTISNYSSGTSIIVSQASSTTYTLVSVTNSTGTTAVVSGSAAITIFEPILGTITHPTCQNTAGSVVITSLPITPWTIKSSTNQVLANRVGVTSFILPLPVGTNNFTITSNTNCVVPYTVIINPPGVLTAPVLNTSQMVCSETFFDQSWTAVENATGYEMDVSPNADFSTFLPGYESKSLGNVTSEKVTGINPSTTYYVRLRALSECSVSANSTAVQISPLITTTYNNGTWSNGLPDTNKHIVFNSTYNVNANMNGCSCQVNAGADVTVQPGIILKLENELNVNPAGSLTFENSSSLVQVNNVVNQGNITYKRNTIVRRYDLTYWSAPISTPEGFTLYNLSPNTLGDKYYTYNPTTTGWVVNYNGTLVMNPGQGYSVRAPQFFDIDVPSLFTAEFKGIPNNGNISSSTYAQNWNLIGNPYPSALDAEKLYDVNPSLGTIYLWTHKTLPANNIPGDHHYYYSNDDWASFNLTGGTRPALSGSETPSGFIGAGQAFISKIETTTVNFTNEMRGSFQNSQFFKGTKSKNAVKDRFWLNFTNEEGAFKQILLGYINGATNSFDNKYDALSLSGAFIDFYSINDGSELVIQGRAVPFQNEDVINLGYNTSIQGVFSITIDKADGIFENQLVYLEDKLTNTYHNLTVCGPYSFETAIGTFNNRFVIHYSNPDNKPALVAPVISEALVNCTQTSYVQEWTAVKNAKGYKIDVALDAGFTSFLAGYENKELGNVTTDTVTGLNPGTAYFVRIRAINDCGSSLNSNVVILQAVSTVYENGVWSNGLPDSTKKIIFSSDYTINTNMNACSCQVNTGAAVTVNSGITLKLQNALNVQGSLTFEDDASLVQVNEVVNTGNIVYKRKISVRRYDLTYWSSPIATPQGFTLYNFSPYTLGDKYFYFDPNNGWTVNYNGTLVMNPGQGYSVRAPQPYDINVHTDFTGVFTGIPNNGNISTSIISNKWHLIGNPYPSAIDVNELYSLNPTLGSLYLWRPISMPNPDYGSDGFTPLNLTGSIKILAADEIPSSEIIGSAQGFMARPTAAAVSFTNNMRIVGSNSQFFKGMNTAAAKDRLWLNLTNTSGEFKQMLIGYIQGAINTLDPNYDAATMRTSSNVDFYSLTGTSKLTIQGRALPFDENDIVPLGYKSNIEGTFTIGIDKVEGLFQNQAVFLEDKTTNTYFDLTSSNYDFSTAAGTFTNRFVIHYVNNTSSATGKKGSSAASGVVESEVLVSVKDNQIGINAVNGQIDLIIIYDVNGRILLEKNNVNESTYLTQKLNSVKQLLIVKTTLKSGKVNTTKVIL